MSPLKVVVLTSLAAVVLTAGGLFRRQQAKAGELDWLHRQNNQMRLKARELVRAQPVAAVQADAVAGSRGDEATGGSRVAAAQEYRPEGRATARAALQTLAWSCDRGDVEALMQLLQLEPEARAKAEAYYASLPVEARGQWKSPEEMVASLVALGVMTSPFPSADVLEVAGFETPAENRMVLRLPGTRKDRTEFRRGDDGAWSCVIDAAAMERCLAFAKEFATLPPRR